VQFLRYFTVAIAVVAAASLDRPAAQQTPGSTFRVFVRGADTGVEEVSITESPSGWTLRGSGKLRAPLNLTTDSWEARYDRSWNPIELTVNLSENANRWRIRTTFSGTSATSDITQNGKTEQRTHTVAADSIALSNVVFGAYEVLAARLATAQPGAQLQAYIAPQDVVSFTAENVTSESIQVPGRLISARRWTLSVSQGPAKLAPAAARYPVADAQRPSRRHRQRVRAGDHARTAQR
jgi:hypothetical protein